MRRFFMGAFGGRTHSFIVRVWLEPREIEGVDPEWRGMVEHVSSGKRRYVTDLGDLSAFIAIYLEDMGVGLHGP